MKCASKVTPRKPIFRADDMNGNIARLLVYLGFEKESDVPVRQFIVTSDGGLPEATRVQQGKYRSALLLYYLASMTAYEDDNPMFTLTSKMRRVIENFFGHELCRQAMTDPDTVHQTIKKLLLGKKVTVRLLA